jgi:hypothetical protein
MTATYEKIVSTTLGSATATVTFSSISGAYTDLVLIMTARNTTSNTYPLLRFNSDSGTNYSITTVVGSAAGAVSYRASSQSSMYINYSDPLPTASSTYATFVVNFQNYSNAVTNKTIISRVANAASATEALVGLWRSTSAINNISITCDAGSYTSGSTFTLYGIKAE